MQSSRQLLALLFLATLGCVSTPIPAPEVLDLTVDLDRCPVHNDLLVEVVQPTALERGSMDPLYWRLRSDLFPCALSEWESGTLARVKYCPTCRVAKAKCMQDEECEKMFPSVMHISEVGHDARKELIARFIERQKRELAEDSLATEVGQE